jgi:hypothetical protein
MAKCPKPGCDSTGFVTGTKRWRDDNGGRPVNGKIMQSVQVAPGKANPRHKRLPCADTMCYIGAKEVKYTPIPQLPRREKPEPKPKEEKPRKPRAKRGRK